MLRNAAVQDVIVEEKMGEARTFMVQRQLLAEAGGNRSGHILRKHRSLLLLIPSAIAIAVSIF